MYGEPTIEEYFDSYTRSQATRMTPEQWSLALREPGKFLPKGRILLLRKLHLRGLLGCVVDFTKTDVNSDVSDRRDRRPVCLVVLDKGQSVPRAIQQRAEEPNSTVKVGQVGERWYMVVEVRVTEVMALGRDKITIDSIAITDGKRFGTTQAVNAIATLYDTYQASSTNRNLEAEDIPTMTGLMSDMDLADARADAKVFKQMAATNQCHECPKREQHLARIERELLMRSQLSQIQFALSEDNVGLIEDFDLRLRVLEHLQYVDSERTVQIKGRVACEVNTCDSLIVTEMIFENVLTDLPPEQSAALLSCLIFQQKATPADIALPPSLEKALEKLQNIALSLGHLQLKKGIDLVPAEYVRASVNPGMLHVAYEWACGTSFAKICEFTEIEEGSIVRFFLFCFVLYLPSLRSLHLPCLFDQIQLSLILALFLNPPISTSYNPTGASLAWTRRSGMFATLLA